MRFAAAWVSLSVRQLRSAKCRGASVEASLPAAALLLVAVIILANNVATALGGFQLVISL